LRQSSFALLANPSFALLANPSFALPANPKSISYRTGKMP
jgi:hypothetical protein